MFRLYIVLVIAGSLLGSCHHSHGPHGHSHEEEGPEPLAYTLYSDNIELFVEFDPLVAHQETKFAAHFTQLGERFTALEEGTVTMTLSVAGKAFSTRAEEPASPGIYRLVITPEAVGSGRLEFIVTTRQYSDTFVIDNIPVHPDEETALAAAVPSTTPADEVSFLKEQAWRIDFAHIPVSGQTFYHVIRTSGQLLTPPSDEALLSSQTPGVVSFSGNALLPGSPVSAGQVLFTIRNNELVHSQADTDLQLARDNLATAKAQYERAKELIKDQLVTEKEYQEAKLRFESAQTVLQQTEASKGYYTRSQTISSPISGFLRSLLVSQGQLVPAGQPLAVVARSNTLLLQANLSQSKADQLSQVYAANFRTANSDRVYQTSELGGRIIARGKSLETGSAFIPLIFEIRNDGTLMPGTPTEVFLLSHAIKDAIVVPVSALVEEQGNFFVYVQTGGESFAKREVKLGGNDGNNVQVLSGLQEGERVVTKGAYQIKLAAASGAMPDHGHEH